MQIMQGLGCAVGRMLEERSTTTTPALLESALLAVHLHELRSGRTVDVPIYDFATYRRGPDCA